MIWLIVSLVVLALVIVWAFVVYNRLVRLRNTVDESFAQIDTQLQRRYDLIPNLVETVKGYAAHEKETLQAVTDARTASKQALDSKNIGDVQKAEAAFDKAMVAINAVGEAYPDLKASANFQQLQEELATTENKVSFARQYYNESVNTYNTATQKAPDLVVAKMFGFKQKDFFKVETDEARKVPKVEF